MNAIKTRRRYTAEFKAQAIELLATGKPVSELARELQISDECHSFKPPCRAFRGAVGAGKLSDVW